MDQEQLEKRVEWLDDERRKDKGTISDLQKKIAKLEGLLDKSTKHVSELSSEVTRLTVVVARVDEFDDGLKAHRDLVKKEMDSQETRLKRRERDAKKRQDLDLDAINKTVAEVRNEINTVAKMREEFLARSENESRINRLISELQEKLKGFDDNEAERNQAIRSMEEDRRQDNKRMTDLQGEVSALRKRTDEQGGKMELITENQKKAENRLTDILATESERREEQAAFVESVNLNQMEWEKTWKEWNKRFEKFDTQTEKLQGYLQNIEDAEREVKKAQEAFEEITDQIKRRINEITEMQRLGEERFRQEWSTFKADDQKRWTNYTLTQEEQHREMNRQLDRLADQSTNLDDNLQELQDSVQHLNEQSDKVLQTFMGAIREWVAENERFLSSVR